MRKFIKTLRKANPDIDFQDSNEIESVDEVVVVDNKIKDYVPLFYSSRWFRFVL